MKTRVKGGGGKGKKRKRKREGDEFRRAQVVAEEGRTSY